MFLSPAGLVVSQQMWIQICRSYHSIAFHNKENKQISSCAVIIHTFFNSKGSVISEMNIIVCITLTCYLSLMKQVLNVNFLSPRVGFIYKTYSAFPGPRSRLT